jgi:hypothetical protein
MSERGAAMTLVDASSGDSFRVESALGMIRARVLWGGISQGKSPWDTVIEAKDPYGKSYEITFGNRDRGHPAAYIKERMGDRKRYVVESATEVGDQGWHL